MSHKWAVYVSASVSISTMHCFQFNKTKLHFIKCIYCLNENRIYVVFFVFTRISFAFRQCIIGHPHLYAITALILHSFCYYVAFGWWFCLVGVDSCYGLKILAYLEFRVSKRNNIFFFAPTLSISQMNVSSLLKHSFCIIKSTEKIMGKRRIKMKPF